MSSRRQAWRWLALFALLGVAAPVVGVVCAYFLLHVSPGSGYRLVLIATGVALFFVCAAAALFAWQIHLGRVNWRRIDAEQALWESGPIGKSWLRIRQRLENYRTGSR